MNPLNPHPSDSFLFLLSKGYKPIQAAHIDWNESNKTIMCPDIFFFLFQALNFL